MFTQTLVSAYKTIQCLSPQNRNMNNRCLENLRSEYKLNFGYPARCRCSDRVAVNKSGNVYAYSIVERSTRVFRMSFFVLRIPHSLCFHLRMLLILQD